jgi:hypothetical protein
MLSQTCARREVRALPGHVTWPYVGTSLLRRNFAGTADGILFGRYARLVGAPNYAPSLCSVAGLLLALALQSGLRGPPPPSLMAQREAGHHCRASPAQHARALPLTARRSAPSKARYARVFSGEPFAQRGVRGCRAKPTARARMDLARGGEGCPLRERPQPASPPGGAVQRAARRRCRRELPKRIALADPARWAAKSAHHDADRLDRRVQCDRFNPIWRECLCVVGPTSQSRGAEHFARASPEYVQLRAQRSRRPARRPRLSMRRGLFLFSTSAPRG